jgi:hypothetical protein
LFNFFIQCPLDAKHHYRFRLFALDVPRIDFQFPSNVTSMRAPEIEEQFDSHVLYVAVLSGTYECPRWQNSGNDVAIREPPHPYVPSRIEPPIEVIRYLKPSESFKKNHTVTNNHNHANKYGKFIERTA